MPPVISVEHLSKSYRLGQIGTGTFARDLSVWWARVRGKPNPLLRIGETDHGNRMGEEIWALRDVSFTVDQGEVLGVIGRNGAGKSTLLKILSRVTAPTSGQVKVRGRIASLLEVGTGFHPELTGRENIYLNGAILGMTRQEVRRKFDEIVAFAEVEKFIDTPVKRYSSGMYVRLAFAVAAHLESEILLVDEVLAVGDAEFQKKCLGKMGDVASKEGRTVLFVSHNMAAVKSLCTRAVLIQAGNFIANGDMDFVIRAYLIQTSNTSTSNYTIPFSLPREGNGVLKFLGWYIESDLLLYSRRTYSCQPCTFKLLYKANSINYLKNVSVTITIKNLLGNPIFSSATWLTDSDFAEIPLAGVLSCRFVDFPLAPGTYVVHLFCSVNNDVADRIINAGTFDVITDDIFGTGKSPASHHGDIIVSNFSWSVDPA